tara:strand:+ start:35 stop:286 length:252 start_codon:yes stop_codon:yes gene_type:complete
MSLYLHFNTPDGAENRSRELWQEHIGRAPDEGATTHFYLHCGDDTQSFMQVSDGGEMLTEEEKQALISEETFQEWRESHDAEP